LFNRSLVPRPNTPPRATPFKLPNIPPRTTPRKVKAKEVAADKAVLSAFKDIRNASRVREERAVPRRVIEEFERDAWQRLLRHLNKLPPVSDLY
jgi:hypothetical protein